MVVSKTTRLGSNPGAPANIMKKKSNVASIRIKKPGEAPDSFIEMQKIVDRVCKTESKKKTTAP